jgi:cell division protein ZapA
MRRPANEREKRMPMIQVTIAGKSYRMACGDGEEAHLEGVAAAFEEKIAELRGSFGEIGDMRLHVMAALTFVDELAETKKRLGAAEEELAALRRIASSDGERSHSLEAQMTDALNRTAERIERLAKTLNLPAQAGATA